MVRRQQMFAATALVSTLALVAAICDTPGAAPITETRNGGTRAAVVPTDSHRPPTEIDGGSRRDEVVEVQSRGANVRVEPALDSPLITTVSKGCLLPVLAWSEGWARVGLDGDRAGWIHGPLVAPTAVGPEPAAERLGPLTGGQGRDPRELVAVRVPHANVREGPATTTAVIATRQGGCLVPVLESRDGWIRIRLDDDGGAGWLQGSLVAPVDARRAQDETPAPPPETRRASAAAPGSSAPLRPEPPRLSAIERAPAPSQGWSGARPVAPVRTGVGPREAPKHPATAIGRSEHRSAATEPSPAERRVEVVAEPPDGGPSRVHRSRAHPVTPPATTTLARVEATAAPPAAAPSPEGRTPDGGRATVPQAGEAMLDDEKLHRFRTTVEHVNERVRRAVGMDVFAKVEDLGDGAVALTATNAWLAAPEAARRANLRTLSRVWGSMHDPDAPVGVRVVNDRGEVMMEEGRGGEPMSAAYAGADG